MTTEIKLIENQQEQFYRITMNGKDAYGKFPFTDNPDEQTDVRRMAKAAAFDLICNAQMNGKVIVTYLSV